MTSIRTFVICIGVIAAFLAVWVAPQLVLLVVGLAIAAVVGIYFALGEMPAWLWLKWWRG